MNEIFSLLLIKTVFKIRIIYKLIIYCICFLNTKKTNQTEPPALLLRSFREAKPGVLAGHPAILIKGGRNVLFSTSDLSPLLSSPLYDSGMQG